MSIHLSRVIELPRVHDARGNLTFIEEDQHVPFPIRRVYYLYDVPGGSSRGGHAHLALQQLLIALSGTFDVHLDDGHEQKTVTLNRSFRGLYLPRMLWRELHNFSSGAVCLCLASEHYSEADYLRDFDDFAQRARNKPVRFVPMLAPALEEARLKARALGISSVTELIERPLTQDEALFAIERDGTRVGACGVRFISQGSAELFGALFEPASRGQGLGRSMVEAMVTQARLRGARRFVVRAPTTDPRSIRMLEQQGFTVGERDGASVRLTRSDA